MSEEIRSEMVTGEEQAENARHTAAFESGPTSNDALKKENEELKNLVAKVERAKREWELIMDCVGDLVALAGKDGKILRVNRALKEFMGKEYDDIIGRDLKETLKESGLEVGNYFDRGTELSHGPSGRWFALHAYPSVGGDAGELSGEVVTIHDSTELKEATEELEKAYNELKATQAQILQQEKMASIGQLAAGIAHEINNPTGFILSNLTSLGKYLAKISDFIEYQESLVESIAPPEKVEEMKGKKKELKVDFIIEDTKDLIEESIEGGNRVKKIVQDLKSFSRVDQAEHMHANINECIESTINIVWNELKYKADLTKDFGELPQTMCYPQQLNQVFMNLLVNASHAIEKKGEIGVKTWEEGGNIYVSVSDTGCGIKEENVSRVFEPFFTTKEVGKGTGLGLSITYDIVNKHGGDISVESKVGEGTTFTVRIPLVDGG